MVGSKGYYLKNSEYKYPYSFDDYKREYNLDFNLGDEVYVFDYRNITEEIVYPYMKKSKVIDISTSEKTALRPRDTLMLAIKNESYYMASYVLLKNIHTNKAEAMKALKDRIKSTEEEVDMHLNTVKTIFLDESKQALIRAEVL